MCVYVGLYEENKKDGRVMPLLVFYLIPRISDVSLNCLQIKQGKKKPQIFSSQIEL